MNLIILGAPGAGKGTLSSYIKDYLKIPHISTGDTLRQAVASNTKIGIEAAGYINNGQFVPDEVVLGIVSWRISESDCKDGFLLDGYPRNEAQARSLDILLQEKGLKLDHVIVLTVPHDLVVSRLVARRTCSGCGKIYNLVNNPPAVEGTCDICSSPLTRRDDDREDVIRKRLEVYDRQTAVLIDYYAQKNLLASFDGSSSPDEVWKEIQKTLFP